MCCFQITLRPGKSSTVPGKGALGTYVFPHYLTPHHKPLTHLTVLTELKAYTQNAYTHTTAYTTCPHFPTIYLFAFSLETKLPREVPRRPFKISGFIATSKANNTVTAQNKRDLHALISILFHISCNTHYHHHQEGKLSMFRRCPLEDSIFYVLNYASVH